MFLSNFHHKLDHAAPRRRGKAGYPRVRYPWVLADNEVVSSWGSECSLAACSPRGTIVCRAGHAVAATGRAATTAPPFPHPRPPRPAPALPVAPLAACAVPRCRGPPRQSASGPRPERIVASVVRSERLSVRVAARWAPRRPADALGTPRCHDDDRRRPCRRRARRGPW